MIATLIRNLVLVFAGTFIVSNGAIAQQPRGTNAAPTVDEGKPVTSRKDAATAGDIEKTPVVSSAQTAPPRQENESEEEAAILPYYNNYLREYHLGPEDVISVEVFGQSNYSKSGIVIPPTSKISYPLIPGGIFVGGKTVEEVAEDIKKKLDEYIIDPQVMVTLDKVGSARFSVLGKVATPGVKVMNRRYNLHEAIAEAGGIEKDGDKKRVLLIRANPQGGVTQTVIDMAKVMKGEERIIYIAPGDQIIIPEKKWSLAKIVSTVSKASTLRILFGIPF
jgi:polysaccharide biosynthesis/export protein